MEAGVTKQAVNKHNRRDDLYRHRLACLILEMDDLREDHPGCGLEKAYYTLKPDWIGRDRFVREFTQLGYQVKRKKNYRRTTIPGFFKYPNLIEGMVMYGINMIWQSDITYFSIGSEFCYIVFITDLFSRSILGYQVSDNLRAEANIKALQMAIKQRNGKVKDLIHHSDKGSQYIDLEYIKILTDHGVHISMGLSAPDNAYAERVNGIIKNEYLAYWSITSLQELIRAVKRAVEHYNNNRQHGSLGKMTPIQFENWIENTSEEVTEGEIIFSKNSSRLHKKDRCLVMTRRVQTTNTIMCPI